MRTRKGRVTFETDVSDQALRRAMNRALATLMGDPSLTVVPETAGWLIPRGHRTGYQVTIRIARFNPEAQFAPVETQTTPSGPPE